MARLYALDTHTNMIEGLCQFLIQRSPSSQQIQRPTRIYLPSRRACRQVELCLKHHKAESVLKRCQFLAMNQPQELYEAHVPPESAALPPVMSRHERLYLVSLIMESAWFDKLSRAQALKWAESITPLLDQWRAYGITPAAIECVVREEEARGASPSYSQGVHSIITLLKHYDAVMGAFGKMDPLAFQQKVHQVIYDFWKHNDASRTYDLIVCGMTQYHPMSADFLKAAHTCQTMHIIVPFFDDATRHSLRHFEEEDPNPRAAYYQLSKLLHHAGVCERDIQPLFLDQDRMPRRMESFIGQGLTHYVQGIRRIIQTQYHAGARAMTVMTPSRSFARTLKAELSLFGISVNDSSSVTLMESSFGGLLKRLLSYLKTGYVSDFLALLKHPGLSYPLHNPVPFAVIEYVDVLAFEKRMRTTPCLTQSMPHDAPYIAGLERDQDITCARLKMIVTEHLGYCDVQKDITERFWQDVDDLMAATGLMGAPSFEKSLSECIDHVLKHTHYAPPVPETMSCDTPCVTLIGLMEGRVERADLTIITHLEDGVYPREDTSNRFMSPRMMRALNLPSYDESIGLQAQDFYQCLNSAHHVVLSYSLLGGETQPSSFWYQAHERYHTVPITLEEEGSGAPSLQHYFQPHAIVNVERTVEQTVDQTDIRLHKDQKPTRLSITALQCLMTDPYAFYVRYILKLRPLFPMIPSSLAFYDHDPVTSGRVMVFGSRLHAGLDAYVKARSQIAHPLFSPGEERFLRDHIDKAFIGFDLSPIEQRRMDGIAHFLTHETPPWQRDDLISVSHQSEMYTEAPMIIPCEGAAQPEIITLYGTADRVDTLKYQDQTMQQVIIDYKTGNPPSYTAIQKGLYPQLPLEGWLLQKKASLHHSAILSYIHLEAKPPFGRYVTLKNPESLTLDVVGLIQDTLTQYLRDDFVFKSVADSAYAEDYKNVRRVS